MKQHKIPGVEKTVCTCEQKIAYNLAFRCHINYWREWDSVKDLGEAERAWGVDSLIENLMIDYDLNALKKYNRAAVKAALAAGLEKYMDRFFIASSYEQIGQAFPVA